jgi:hypothetical protein
MGSRLFLSKKLTWGLLLFASEAFLSVQHFGAHAAVPPNAEEAEGSRRHESPIRALNSEEIWAKLLEGCCPEEKIAKECIIRDFFHQVAESKACTGGHPHPVEVVSFYCLSQTPAQIAEQARALREDVDRITPSLASMAPMDPSNESLQILGHGNPTAFKLYENLYHCGHVISHLLNPSNPTTSLSQAQQKFIDVFQHLFRSLSIKEYSFLEKKLIAEREIFSHQIRRDPRLLAGLRYMETVGFVKGINENLPLFSYSLFELLNYL